MLKIAIIVPIYNAGGVLNACIKSLAEQTYEDINIILVDDGSKDDSGKICDGWKEKDSRIFVIHQENQGSTAARKAGVFSDIAQSSDYIMFCDADDEMPQNSVEIMVQQTQIHNADCVCGQTEKHHGKIKHITSRECFNITEPKCFNSHQEIIDGIYLSCFGLVDYPVSLCAKLFRTQYLTIAFNEPPTVKFFGDDLEYNIRFLPLIEKLVLVPNVVYYYNYGGNTKRFMPYAFDDCLALYGLKDKYANVYFKDNIKEAYHFMKTEMMWMTLGRFTDVYTLGDYKKKQVYEEIQRVCEIETVRISAEYVATLEKHALHDFAKNILERDVKKIWRFVHKEGIIRKIKKTIKGFIIKFK